MERLNIESAQYFQFMGENCSISVVIDGQLWSVPLDPANTTYAEIMRQVEAGELVIQDAES